jgi:hypothetical protein
VAAARFRPGGQKSDQAAALELRLAGCAWRRARSLKPSIRRATPSTSAYTRRKRTKLDNGQLCGRPRIKTD